jgi:hypothetical protein
MELKGYRYTRRPDPNGRHVHAVECYIDGRHCRFEAETKERADTLALMAENTARFRAEQAEAHRQMVLEEQRRVIALSDARVR